MKSSLFILISWTIATSVTAGQIKVVDEITKKGLVSEIYKESNGKRTPVGSTNPSGIYVTTEPGKAGERFFAVNQEYDPNSTTCPVTLAVIPLKKTRLVRALLVKAEFYVSTGESGAAALQYKKAADEAKRLGDAKARLWETKAAKALAAKLSVKNPLVISPPGNEPRPTAEFGKKIIKFQREKGVEPDGKLTMETYEKAADRHP